MRLNDKFWVFYKLFLNEFDKENNLRARIKVHSERRMEPRLERKGEKSSFEFISSTKIRMMEFLLNINDETLAKYMKLDA